LYTPNVKPLQIATLDAYFFVVWKGKKKREKMSRQKDVRNMIDFVDKE
jgi:hypothetical protein